MHETLGTSPAKRGSGNLSSGRRYFFLFFFLVVPKETVHLLLFVIIKYFTSVVMVTSCAVDATFAFLFLALFRDEGKYSRIRISSLLLSLFALRCVHMVYHSNLAVKLYRHIFTASICLLCSRSEYKISENKSDLIPYLGFCALPCLLSPCFNLSSLTGTVSEFGF